MRRGRPRGLTLAELMMALAVLLVAALALLGLFTWGLRSQAHNRTRTLCLMLAQQKLEELAAQPRHLLAEEEGRFPDPHQGYTYRVDLAERGPHLVRVTVRVAGPGEVAEELETLLQLRPGKIAFQLREENGDLYRVNADGTELERLTWHEARDAEPDLSPDGTELVFVSWREERTPQLYLMDLETRRIRRLTHHPRGARTPRWSPDGERIAYVASDAFGATHLWVTDRKGGGGSPVTFGRGPDFGPSWSPDGRALVFASRRDGDLELYVAPLGGTPKRLTRSPGWDMSPAWSPDGERILFVSQRDGSSDLYTITPDGSQVVRLTETPEVEREPAWSPDGRKVVFAGDGGEPGRSRLYVMNADGTARQELETELAGRLRAPSWGP